MRTVSTLRLIDCLDAAGRTSFALSSVARKAFVSGGELTSLRLCPRIKSLEISTSDFPARSAFQMGMPARLDCRIFPVCVWKRIRPRS